MKIAVIGAGAIGGLIAAYLKSKGEDVSVVGRPESVAAIQENGISVSGVRGELKVAIGASEKLSSSPELAILCTKTQDLEKVLQDNLIFLQDSLILTTQNGIKADALVADYLRQDRIVSSIVMFGATNLEPGKVVHNFEGSWILGNLFDADKAGAYTVREPLALAFDVVVADDIRPMKYLKLFVNSNNCIPAILGVSMQEAFSDPRVSLISVAIWKEGLNIVHSAGIKLASLPDFPLERVTGMTSMPLDEAAKLFSNIMSKLSKEPLYGSILQSLKRGRASEIDYINGEFVSLAKANKLEAPLNEKLVMMVHAVEKTGLFFTKEELLQSTAGLCN